MAEILWALALANPFSFLFQAVEGGARGEAGRTANARDASVDHKPG